VHGVRVLAARFFRRAVAELSDALRHEARLAQRVPKSETTYREHYTQIARTNRRAREALRPKPYPREVEYLRTWVFELHGRSGLSQSGVSPLRWTELSAWQQATGVIVTAEEQRALVQLDAVLCHPGSFDEKES
jgi:hypothetical protein